MLTWQIQSRVLQRSWNNLSLSLEDIRAMLQRHKIGDRKLELGDLRRFSAGADVLSRQGDGSTVAQQYEQLGIRLKLASMDRLNGWAELMQGFGKPENDVQPTLFIHQRCKRLIETIPTLQHDPNRPEDVLKVDADEDGVGGADAADALRYLVATKEPDDHATEVARFLAAALVRAMICFRPG